MSALGHWRTCALHQPMFALPPIATLAAFFGMSALGQKRRLRGLAIKARWRRTTAFDIGISTDFNVRFRLRLRFVDVRFGSKADICAAKRHVRFTPESNRNSRHRGFPMRGQSTRALPPQVSNVDLFG